MTIELIAQQAQLAARKLATIPGQQRQQAISAMPEKLIKIKDELNKANKADVADAKKAGTPAPLIKRLEISDKVFHYMLNRLQQVAALADPVGCVLEGHTRPNGLKVQKISVPIGVIGMIYESRPNVTTDAASVCLKSGNAVILRGGSESLRTNIVLADAMISALEENGLPHHAVQIIRKSGHKSVTDLISQEKYIDVIIPRGGKNLIREISQHSRVPVIKHYEGICHLYIAADANAEMAIALAVNSKTQRVEVCNALETLLVDVSRAAELIPKIKAAFDEKQVTLLGCERTLSILPGIQAATEEDWSTEYLAPILSVRIVDGMDQAIDHINTYGSGHTDVICTPSLQHAQQFIDQVDSASVLVNASTRLSGGEDYGLGAVVGISTDKLHARGPVGPSDLTSYKWIATGQGHLRR